jgi:hypothetical protein
MAGEEAADEVARAELAESRAAHSMDEVARSEFWDADNLDYLNIGETDQQVLGNLKAMADHLKLLADKVMEAEAVYKQLQQEYDTYRFQTLPAAMQSAGVMSVTTSDGHRIEVKNKFYCNPNKNDNDRLLIGKWLASHGAAHLIKKQAVVDGQQLAKLDEAGVPYVEKWDMNTNSLKAWIKDQLGLGKAGIAQISTSDIPDCIHFIQVDEVELTV